MKKYLFTSLSLFLCLIPIFSQQIKISGSDYVCAQTTETYTLDNISTEKVKSVEWSHGKSANGGPHAILVANGLSCAIENRYGYPLEMNLKATITLLTGEMITVQKIIKTTQKTTEMTGSYSQSAAGVVNRAITYPVFIRNNYEATFKLNQAKGKDLKHNEQDSYRAIWRWDKTNGILTLTLPLYSGGMPYTFYIGDKKCPDSQIIVFGSTTRSVVSEDTYQTLRVYSINTGQKVLEEKNIANFNINNTNIQKGVYIIEMVDNEGNIDRKKVMKE